MIIACPSCATHYDMPAPPPGAESTMIRCAACGHGWLEARAVEVIDVTHRNAPAVIDHGFEPDQEIRRLVEASKEAQDKFATRRQARRRRAAGWSVFAAAALSPLIMAAAFPADIVKFAPATISAYRALGHDVNVYGLDLRHVEMQHLTVDGAEILAVKGEIANISGGERKIPSLRFGLDDNSGNEVYHWTLDSGMRPLRAGEITGFVTRVASPPEIAKNIEIRFAHADEIGSNTGHE